jgi:hypothetical protein
VRVTALGSAVHGLRSALTKRAAVGVHEAAPVP